ncbi:MAG: Crp/Fnr family transcriptional regulator [Solirubrobacterales bacterium]
MVFSDEGWYAAIRDRVGERAVKAGQPLFRQGDVTFAIFAVVSGRIRLVRHTVEGAAVVLHVAEAGDTFAEAALFSDVYHCDAVAATDCRVEVVPKPVLLNLFATDPNASTAFMGRLARQVQGLRSRLEIRNIRSAEERVRQYLTLLAGVVGTVNFDRPLKDVATDIGLTHEAFYRALASLARRGELVRDGRVISIGSQGND